MGLGMVMESEKQKRNDPDETQKPREQNDDMKERRLTSLSSRVEAEGPAENTESTSIDDRDSDTEEAADGVGEERAEVRKGDAVREDDETEISLSFKRISPSASGSSASSSASAALRASCSEPSVGGDAAGVAVEVVEEVAETATPGAESET